MTLSREQKISGLAHGFFSSFEFHYIQTSGGQEKIFHKLKLCEGVFFPLVFAIDLIKRAYASEYGFTNEVFDRLLEKRKQEQEQIDADLKDILPDESADENSG